MVLSIGMEVNGGEIEVIFYELKKNYDPFYFLFVVLLWILVFRKISRAGQSNPPLHIIFMFKLAFSWSLEP